MQCPRPPSEINEFLLKRKIIGGLDISEQVERGLLVCVTEMNTKDDIDALAKALSDVGGR